MSDGSSSTQNGVIGDQEVADVVDSLDSITTTNSDEEEGNSDCSSDIGSSYLTDEEQPVSIVTNIRSVNPADEEVDEKSPTGNRIAKDTGCCLYSAITAIFVMVVLLGIVLIVTGPVLGLSFPPLLRANTPAILPPIQHNYLTANFSDPPADADYAEQYDSGEGYNNDTLEYVDYLQEQNNLTDTAAIFNESVIEDLANLSPEALRTKYVAYVPIPLKIDDDQQTEYVDDTDINDRIDDDYHQNDDDYEEQATPRSSSSRRRPVTVDKVLLPIIMVPSDEDKSSRGSDSWRFNDQDPPRRFDESEMTMDDEEQDLTSSSSRRIPGLNPPRRRPSGDGRKATGIDYRMFGSLNHEDIRRNKRPNRQRDRLRPRDDFGRTTSLHPHRVLPPGSRSRPRINKSTNRQRTVEGREGGSPPLYIRPPPRPRPRTPARQVNTYKRVHRPPVQQSESWPIRKRTNDPPPSPVTKRPAYSYPRDAMSIQDIISYMTSMSHSNDQTTKKPSAPAGPEHRSAVWENQDYYSNNQRRVGPYPSILPAPPSMGISRTQDNLPVESHTRRVPDSENPYSFKLDVYPIRDSLGRGSTSSSSNNVPPGPSYREQSVLPPTNYRYRPNYESDSSDPYYSYRPQRRPSHQGSQEKVKYRDNDDDMPLPLAFRPRRPQSITTAKPKLIVHLNVFNQNKGGRNRYAEERRDDEEVEEYYSPSDIYRAVLRNNAAKTTDDHHEGGDDMPSGQSRVDTFSQTNAAAVDPSPSSSVNSYDSHNMAVSASQDQYINYNSVGMRRSPSVADSGNNYRISHQSRNFYPAIDDDVPEPLPMPMAASSSDCDSCTFQGSVVNKTLTITPLVS